MEGRAPKGPAFFVAAICAGAVKCCSNTHGRLALEYIARQKHEKGGLMRNANAMRMKMAIPVLLAMFLALAGAVAFAAIAPAQAQAKGTTTMYVLAKHITKGDDGGSPYVETYAYTKSRLVSVGDLKYSYDSKGKVKQRTFKKSAWNKYTYDAKGQLKESVNNFKENNLFENAYKNGLLTKQHEKGFYEWETHTFKYKKVKVPTKLAKMVVAQQRSLIDGIVPLEAAHK